MGSRGTETNRLADVIQVLQMARKTGLLVVARDDRNDSVEQGTITLQNGEIVDAHIGLLRGAAAFNNLMAWGHCYFVLRPPATTNGTYTPFEVGSNGSSPGQAGRVADPSGSQRVPYPVRPAQEVLAHFSTLGLTRTHRQLFLLIDGKRNREELMRLLRYRSDEIHSLLLDLERTGLIRQ